MSDLRKAAEMAFDYILREGWTNSQGKEVFFALSQVLEESANSTTSVVESKTLAQPEQEPVLWLDEETQVIYRNNTHEVDRFFGFKPTTPLYTAPPKREWVDLDEEEQKECWDDGGSQWAIYQNIASKLKEKNT